LVNLHEYPMEIAEVCKLSTFEENDWKMGLFIGYQYIETLDTQVLRRSLEVSRHLWKSSELFLKL